MKRAVIAATILLCVYPAWAQQIELNIVNYTINGENVTGEYSSATIKWESKRAVRTNRYGEDFTIDVYELEIRLHKLDAESIENIILTEGHYTGGYNSFTFDTVIFPRNPEIIFRCGYYEDMDDRSRGIHFYDTNSESRQAYAVLELRQQNGS